MLKNRLKDLIYIQENKPCSEETVRGVFRALLEALLEAPVEGIVMHRLKSGEKIGASGLLKRLEYTEVKVFDFADGSGLLKSQAWENTEFLYVLTGRYGAVFVWDYETADMDGFAGYYLLHNSRDLSISYDVVEENCTEDISEYQELYKPDRRDNLLMNASIRKIVDLLSDTTQEAMLSGVGAEALSENEKLTKRIECLSKKASYASHEIRNQLSICDLYLKIMSAAGGADAAGNAAECIKKALRIANTALLDLKNFNNYNPVKHCVKELAQDAVELAKVYALGKEIEFEVNALEAEVFVDYDKFLAVLINLLKNAVEADDTSKVTVNADGEMISIFNNGKAIDLEMQEKIFEEGFTTKDRGCGIGLAICKESLRDMGAELRLIRSDESGTEFVIEV